LYLRLFGQEEDEKKDEPKHHGQDKGRLGHGCLHSGLRTAKNQDMDNG
jgi:hypothetical protein